MPTKIYLIRHGETDYNKIPRMQGWLDIPLNETGRAQALVTAESLTHVHLDAIYSSDLSRAQETAEPLARVHQLKIHVTEHLRERDMGVFSGWNWVDERDEEKDKIWKEFEVAQNANDLDWNSHRGESLRQMSDRIEKLMIHLHENHANQTVALVTHGGTINRFLEYFGAKETIEGYRAVGNGAVHLMVKEEKGYILKEL